MVNVNIQDDMDLNNRTMQQVINSNSVHLNTFMEYISSKRIEGTRWSQIETWIKS